VNLVGIEHEFRHCRVAGIDASAKASPSVLRVPYLQAVPVNYVMIWPKDSATSIANSRD
jgi:hypothetical protein